MTLRLPQRTRIATFSIVATDGVDWGVAVASKFLAVGSAVPAAQAEVGALATQAMANTSYKVLGMELLEAGRPASEVVEVLTGDDEGREHRQLGVVDRHGGAATYTGSQCYEWAGGRTGKGCACQGNILTGPEVVDSLLTVFEASTGDLVDRLMAALAAGDEAGGDKRGRQSAALLVVRRHAGYGGFDDRMVDLRVDDHPRPIPELSRLLDFWRLYFNKASAESLLPVDDALLSRLRQALESSGRIAPKADLEDVWAAFQAWVSEENLEERATSRETIDPLVLAKLEALPSAG
ncbi:MAG TPA: DUF1028 domain-containing protein [Candidatus Dormibacteraeota bacterium]|nr:DUF1028 domain-containing protein [Candidatus Dormibacteraeota bacterium]